MDIKVIFHPQRHNGCKVIVEISLLSSYGRGFESRLAKGPFPNCLKIEKFPETKRSNLMQILFFDVQVWRNRVRRPVVLIPHLAVNFFRRTMIQTLLENLKLNSKSCHSRNGNVENCYFGLSLSVAGV